MLYSLAANVAFAHYPKTAGSAIAEWFRRSFPDARYVKPGHPHVAVRRTLAWLSGGRSLSPFERARYLVRASNWMLPIEPIADIHSRIRIIGVVREPLEMLASLYEYWRRGDTNPNPRDALVTAAWEGRFPEFVRRAIDGRLESYHDFFDAGGPAWPNTRLVHFDDVAGGIARACREFGLNVPVLLPQKNCGTGTSSRIAEYTRLAGPLTSEVRRHFAWYHDTFGHADHPATCRRSLPHAAAA
jgi:hypothetical protein